MILLQCSHWNKWGGCAYWHTVNVSLKMASVWRHTCDYQSVMPIADWDFARQQSQFSKIFCQMYDKSNHTWEEQSLIKDFLKISDNRKSSFPLILHNRNEIAFHDSHGPRSERGTQRWLVKVLSSSSTPCEKNPVFLSLLNGKQFYILSSGERIEGEAARGKEYSNGSIRAQ